ncbi:MAG: 50S ribosomal protein L29, partial [Candidatus Komeilibacteria bacterium RIFCSPLOWO2_02_FULL_48_11]
VDLRFKAATGALKQVHQIKKLRRAITRLITRLAQIKNSK